MFQEVFAAAGKCNSLFCIGSSLRHSSSSILSYRPDGFLMPTTRKAEQKKKLLLLPGISVLRGANCERNASSSSFDRPKQTDKQKGRIRDSIFENPVAELQKYLETPLLEEEFSFHPTRDAMEVSERLFTDLGRTGVYRMARARSPQECPNTEVPEIAMLGYSNVGKSSLIKALFHRCPRLKVETSKTPGHTKTVDFFRVHDGFVLVDMPGYGYRQPESFATTVGSYLNRRQNLRCAFLLFSPEQGIRQEDQVVIKKLESLEIDYALILTKIDLFSKSQKLRTLLEIRRFRDTFARRYCYQQPFLVSLTGEGLGFLQAFIASLCQKL